MQEVKSNSTDPANRGGENMMYVRAMLTALIVLTGVEAVALAQQVSPASGYVESRATDTDVVAAARFSLGEASRRERATGTHVSIRRAETREPAKRKGALASTRKVKVYLIALDDQGRSGRKIGCDDSLVPVTRTIKATAAPLRAALQELLSIPRKYEGRLSNSWWGRNLKLRTVSLRAGVATIRINGDLLVAGVCDQPRIEAQITETARQFPGVRKVNVFVNGLTLAEAVR
jgi:spore germination protein GerM